MIPGRPNVGDVQSRRMLAILDVRNNRSVWADASAFAGVERKAKPADADVPRLLNWTVPDVSDDGSQTVVAVRALDNKDRWFVKVDPATGKASVLDNLHDDAWIREQSIGGPAGGGARADVAARQQARAVPVREGRVHARVFDGCGRAARRRRR